jgi:hypothetical protein
VHTPFYYVEQFHDEQLEELRDKNVVGADRGKFNLIYLSYGRNIQHSSDALRACPIVTIKSCRSRRERTWQEVMKKYENVRRLIMRSSKPVSRPRTSSTSSCVSSIRRHCSVE